MANNRIFIIDNGPTIRHTLSDILRAKGYAPIAVDTGGAAPDRVAEESPVVALIDLRLEDVSGLDLARGIKARSPATKCIVLTGYASQAPAIEAVNLGAYSCVPKPYELEQLLVTIKRAMEKHEIEETPRESEERFLIIVETAPGRLLITDAEGNTVHVSLNCETWTGHAQQELLDRFIWWVHEDDSERAREAFERTYRDVSGADLEYKAVRKNGDVWYA